MQGDVGIDRSYEPPTLIVLGPVEELTLGSTSGSPIDGSATYAPESDVRLKRGIRRMPNALDRLRRLSGAPHCFRA